MIDYHVHLWRHAAGLSFAGERRPRPVLDWSVTLVKYGRFWNMGNAVSIGRPRG